MKVPKAKTRPIATVLAMGLVMSISGVGPHTVYAATLPGKITALPNPPGAPQRDVFLVTFAKVHKVPSVAVFHFESKKHQHITAKESLRKLNTYQYETYWAAPSQGHVDVAVYTASKQLVAQSHLPVEKAKQNVFGRVALGAVFIGASLWFWWRQQRFYRSRR